MTGAQAGVSPRRAKWQFPAMPRRETFDVIVIGSGAAGLRADPNGRVVHVRGHAMAGLYAVGNAAAHTEYGSGYQTGFSLASGMVFGRLAARDIAGPGSMGGRAWR